MTALTLDYIREYMRENGASIYDWNDLIFMSRDEINSNTNGLVKDVLDNGGYNTLRISAVLDKIDPTIDVEMRKRNGADYFYVQRGEIIHGEMKAGKLKGSLNTSGSWQFHALAIMANGDEDNFLLYVHKNGIPQRIYDVRDPVKVRAINEHITALATKWKTEVVSGVRNGKHDPISLKENIVRPLFEGSNIFEYDNGMLTKTGRADIMQDQRAGVVSIYSDYLA